MGFIKFFVNKSIFVNLIAIFITLIGAVTFMTSAKEVYPQIKIGYIVITAVYPQAGPEEIEKLLTIPLENAIEDVQDIKKIDSWSSEGLCMIGVEILPSVKDTKKVLDDIKTEVDRVTDLPKDAEDVEVMEISTDFFPLINVSVSGGKNYQQLRDAAKLLEERIEEIKGVGDVRRNGYYDKVIWVDADKKKLDDYGLTLFNFISVLQDRDISMPAGNKEFKGREHAVRLLLPMETAQDVRNVIIRSNELGNSVQVRDVANVTDGFKDEDLFIRAQGNRAVLLEVLKQKDFDTIKMVANLKKEIKQIRKELPKEVKVDFSNDMSIYLKNRLDVLYSNGLFGAVLVILMLILLLRPSVAVMTSLGMPVAFAAAFYVANSLGVGINLMSILGYIMVLGLVVDDAIVVGENVYRHLEMGKEPKEAAIDGAKEMVMPVIASVATTIAAFSPLMMVGGMMGQFLSAIPKVIIIALAASLVECFFILPSHLADFVKKKDNVKSEARQEHWFVLFKEQYGKILNWVLYHRKIFATSIIVLLIVASALEFRNGFVFTDAQVSQINIELKTNKDFSVNETEDVVKTIEKAIQKLPEKDLDVINSYVGVIAERHGPPLYAPNYAQLTVLLHIEDKRETKDANKIVEQIREWIGKPEGIEEIKIDIVKGGPPTGDPIDISLSGDSYEELNKVSAEMMKDFYAIEMELSKKHQKKAKNGEATFKPVKEVKSDFEVGKNEIRLIIDESKATLAGVNLGQASNILRSAIAGIKLKTIKKLGEDIDVMVRVNEQTIENLDQLLNLRIPNQMGNRILLREIVKVGRGTASSTRKHLNGKRTISVRGSIDQTKTNVNAVNQKINKKLEEFKAKYAHIKFEMGGEQKEMMEGFMDLAKAFGVAFFLIFIILATLFNSLIQPAIIMLAIPFGFIGVMLTLLIHGMPVSFMAFMGFIGLSGVVVNDSLILVSFINKLVAKGTPMDKAILEGAKTRLRPVTLTTITTAVGLFPLAYGWFGGDEPFIAPMALVFAWGLVFATVVTLFIIPSFMAIAYNAKVRFRRIFKKDHSLEPVFKKAKKTKIREIEDAAFSEHEKGRKGPLKKHKK